MKKTIVLLAAASAMFTTAVSCKKKNVHVENDAITQTESVSLSANEAYYFTLPKNLRDDPYEITKQASHYNISEVGLNSSGERIYKYTPALNFIGTDVVVVSNDQERDEHKMRPEGPHPLFPKAGAPPRKDCHEKEGEEDHYIITFNFTIIGTENPAEKEISK